jgi:hypothetical protein
VAERALIGLIKEWIHFYFSDRINRMNWILSRFPDETVKIASAFRREIGDLMREIANAVVFQQITDSNRALTLAISFSAKRIAYTRFHLETGCKKYPNYPVNPVYFKK